MAKKIEKVAYDETASNELLAAVEAGDLPQVNRLLKVGADPNVRGKYLQTPLHEAATHGFEEIFFALVKAGADLHAVRGQYGDPVLARALRDDSDARVRMVQAILADGLRPTDNIHAMIAFAAGASRPDIVRELLNRGADPNSEDLPLWWAVRKERTENVAELIRGGAKVNFKIPRQSFGDNTYARKTLLDAAVGLGHQKIAKLLEAAGATATPAAMPKKSIAPTDIKGTWKRIAAALKKTSPDWKPLKKGLAPAKLAAAEKKLGFALPDELRESYQTHDGNPSASVFPRPDDIAHYLMPLEAVVEDWKMLHGLLVEFKPQDTEAKCNVGIQKRWWHEAWIPFASNGGGDYLCLDIAPAKGGKNGQVIHFRHDSPNRTLVAPSLLALLVDLADGLESEKYSYDEDEDEIV